MTYLTYLNYEISGDLNEGNEVFSYTHLIFPTNCSTTAVLLVA